MYGEIFGGHILLDDSWIIKVPFILMIVVFNGLQLYDDAPIQ